ncbi:MAG: transcription antitermination factor NusB [Ruminococcus sp.]|nr:transcription antitermination factor NusB [Ruminococcus sp.]
MSFLNEKEYVNLTRSEAREQAFMLLFSKSFDDEPLEMTIDEHSEMFIGGVCAYAQAVVTAIEDKEAEIDEDIKKYLKKGWSLSRISKPSLAILRLAIYEIKYVDNVPDSVAISEAVELAKKYTIDENKFINGILGSFNRDYQAEANKK